MKKRTSASNIMRLVSIVGIICLLALQWVWWRNAYRAVETDFMSKAEECLKLATEKAVMYQLDSVHSRIQVVNEHLGEKAKTVGSPFTKHTVGSTLELGYLLESAICVLKRPVTKNFVDKYYGNILKEKFGFVPQHTIQIIRDSLLIEDSFKTNINRISIGKSQDTIFHQFGFKAYVIAIFPSPIEHILHKGAFILIVSIVLVLLIGTILILQFISMQRDRKFADFIVDYTRMMTHDLRTPVSGIQMIFKKLLKEQKAISENNQDKYLIEGVNLTKKTLLNLDNILYMAKSEQMELPIHLLNVEIQDFMEKTVEMYRERDYNPKTVTIETIYDPEPFICSMDASLMENVVCNLIDNAIKFTGIQAKITVICKRDNDVVEFRFRDNGMGMTEEDQKRIFEIFERGSANKNKQFPGFGIGLHFVQRVVKAHGGKITVKSEVGQGTEFTIRFFA